AVVESIHFVPMGRWRPTQGRSMSLVRKSVRKRGIKLAPVLRSVGEGNGAPAKNGAPFKIPDVQAPTFPPRVVDIREHGAVDDAGFENTLAIAAAIDACTNSGGGRVLIPPGQWLTGPIRLNSNIDLHIAQGATLRFVSDPEKYLPAVFVRWGGQECYNYSPLIYARGCENIAITGGGVLMGQGTPWWPWHKQQQQVRAKLTAMVLAGVPVKDRRFGSIDEPLRPQFISPINCTNVLLEDFTIGEGGPCWTIHLAYCQNVTIRRLK